MRNLHKTSCTEKLIFFQPTNKNVVFTYKLTYKLIFIQISPNLRIDNRWVGKQTSIFPTTFFLYNMLILINNFQNGVVLHIKERKKKLVLHNSEIMENLKYVQVKKKYYFSLKSNLM